MFGDDWIAAVHAVALDGREYDIGGYFYHQMFKLYHLWEHSFVLRFDGLQRFLIFGSPIKTSLLRHARTSTPLTVVESITDDHHHCHFISFDENGETGLTITQDLLRIHERHQGNLRATNQTAESAARLASICYCFRLSSLLSEVRGRQ